RLAQGASLDPFSEPTSERELLPPATSLAEAIMLGLRLAQGIEPTRLAERFDTPFWTEERAKSFSRLLDQGLLVSDASAPSEAKRVSIPHRHWLLADGIIARLL